MYLGGLLLKGGERRGRGEEGRARREWEGRGGEDRAGERR